MAAGDIVNFVAPAVNTAINYQPAAGVEILISSASLGGLNASPKFTDGVFVSICSFTMSGASPYKIFINNTYYLHIEANTGQQGSFSGIQIK